MTIERAPKTRDYRHAPADTRQVDRGGQPIVRIPRIVNHGTQLPGIRNQIGIQNRARALQTGWNVSMQHCLHRIAASFRYLPHFPSSIPALACEIPACFQVGSDILHLGGSPSRPSIALDLAGSGDIPDTIADDVATLEEHPSHEPTSGL